MAKREEESPVSLFSFQDIITSITGIMFLIVLLLLLVMLSSHISENSAENNELLQTMKQEIAELKEVLYKLQNDQQTLDQAAAELKKLTPAELAAQKLALQNQLLILRQKTAQHDSNLVKKQKQLENIQSELRFLQERYNNTVSENNKLTASIKNIASENQQLKQRLTMKKRLIKYSITNRTAKTPLIAEVSADGIILLDVAGNKIINLQVSNNPTESLRRMEKHLDTLDNQQFYLSTAVKPGGFKCAIQLLNILKKRQFERGIEILPDDSTTLIGTGEK